MGHDVSVAPGAQAQAGTQPHRQGVFDVGSGAWLGFTKRNGWSAVSFQERRPGFQVAHSRDEFALARCPVVMRTITKAPKEALSQGT